VLSLTVSPFSVASARDATSQPIDIVGGLGGVAQYTELEEPFWTRELFERSEGRLSARIRPVDSGAFRGHEMLQLMRLGVVPFGTALLSVVSGDEPELNAIDLPILNPDVATLRKTVGAFRQHLGAVLRERYDIELLGVYAYSSQVLFCKEPFWSLADVQGRKVRTSSVGQSELVSALGGVPVLVPFAEIVIALRNGVADCAITGTLSGFEIGLPRVTTHVHSVAISWGISFFGANRTYWNRLPADLRAIIRGGVNELERRIWLRAEDDTQRGLDCNAGDTACKNADDLPDMTVVPMSEDDRTRRERLLRDAVIPNWISRCGDPCTEAWNTYLSPLHTLVIPTNGAAAVPIDGAR